MYEFNVDLQVCKKCVFASVVFSLPVVEESFA